MTQKIDEGGEVYPVTILQLEPNRVIEKRTQEKDSYESIVLGYGSVKESKVNKPRQGYFEKLGVTKWKNIKEFRTNEIDKYEANTQINLDIFEIMEKVNVRGKTIGKGTAGTVKRHGFAVGPMTHGSKSHRQPGSIGGGTDPGRTFKGQKMPGQMGDDYRTIKNLVVIDIDLKKGLLVLKGAIPGKTGNEIEVFN